MRDFKEQEILNIFRDDEQLQEFLDNLSGQDVKDLLIYINSKVRNIPIEEGGILEEEGEFMRAGSLIAPKREIQEKCFDKIADSLKNIEGRKNKGCIMYYLINELHLFEDGNGRTSRCVYEMFANPEFDFEQNDHFAHDKDDMAKVSSADFEVMNHLMKTEKAGNISSFFLYRTLVNNGLIKNEDFSNSLLVDTYIEHESIGQYNDVIEISEEIKNQLSLQQIDLINQALNDNNENYSTAGLTLLVMEEAKGQLNDLTNLVLSGKKLEGHDIEVVFDIGKAYKGPFDGNMVFSDAASIFRDWSKDDYLRTIEIANLLKEANLDVMIDIFENPEYYQHDAEQLVAEKYTNDNDWDNCYTYREMALLFRQDFRENKNARTLQNIEKIKEILEQKENINSQNIIPEVQEVQNLGKQTMNQQNDTFAKEDVQKDMDYQQKELDINLQRGE